MANGRAWTPDEDKKLITLRDRHHHGYATIGAKLDRRANVCSARYRQITGRNALGLGVNDRAPIISVKEIDAAKHGAKARSIIDDGERRNDARAMRDHHDLMRGIVTTSFFGDPEPGRSALDRKRAGV